MKANVGSSVLKNSFEAGIEVANNSLKGIKNPKLGFLFTSVKYNQQSVIDGIKSVNSNIKIIGCTSGNCILSSDGIISGENGYASMLVLEDNELSVGVASMKRGNDARLTGQEVTVSAMKDANKKHRPIAYALFTTPGEEEQYIKGVQDVIGDIPMFGGSASDDDMSSLWSVFSDLVIDDGVAIALFYTTKDIKSVFANDYVETDNVGIIKEVENNRRIIKIDDNKALDGYASMVNKSNSDLMGQNIYQESLLNPLGYKSDSLVLLRQPLVANPGATFNVGASIEENVAVIKMCNDLDGLINGNINTLKELNNDFNPMAMLLLQSIGRRKALEDRLDELFVAIENNCGNALFIAPFTFSEFGQVDHSGVKISNLSMSFTGFNK